MIGRYTNSLPKMNLQMYLEDYFKRYNDGFWF